MARTSTMPRNTMRLFFQICCIFIFSVSVSSISPQQHNVVASWVTPSCSHSYNAPSLPSRNSNRDKLGKPNARSSSSSYLRLAVQDKILEDLRMKWENNAEERRTKKNRLINGKNQSKSKQRVPFVIQKIGRGKTSEIEEITRMCIDVFFNEQDEQNVNVDENGKKKTAPWKALQLAYLRNFQQGDILARNAFKQDQLVNLIVARRVYPSSDATNINGNKAEIIYDERQIYNSDLLSATAGKSGEKYVTGEIVGYSEVSEKLFGLGSNFDNSRSKSSSDRPRPYLSNLSVVEDARQSGVGSKLLDACEESVREWNAGHTEIVLQVEEDNLTAIGFYKRRGWEYVFADPTCRRYDTSGFFLRESRITKYTMIKRLDSVTDEENEDGEENDPASSFIRKLKNSFFVQ